LQVRIAPPQKDNNGNSNGAGSTAGNSIGGNSSGGNANSKEGQQADPKSKESAL
jgi:hypothetical protein